MVRRLLFFLAALCTGVYSGTVFCSAGFIKRVNPMLGQGTWLIENRIGSISDLTTPIMVFNSDIVDGSINLNAAGTYQLAEDLNATVSITAAQVSLDLANYTISVSSPSAHAVAVTGVSQVQIANGYLRGAGQAGSSGCGIIIEAGSSDVVARDMTISGHGTGVFLAGTSSVSTVSACFLQGLNLVSNDIGLLCSYASISLIKKCTALYSGIVGFSLLNSESNCFYDCAALKTGGDSGASVSVAGFRSSGGTSNLFSRCTAQQTRCVSNNFGDTACGFILTGSEQKTKIIDSLVSGSAALSSTVVATYGINIEPTSNGGLTAVSGFPVAYASERHPCVAWSPDGKYCAMTRVHSTEGNGVTVFGWDTTSLTQITSFTGLTALPNAIAWSPDGKYVAAVDGASGAGRLYAYMFDGSRFNDLYAGGVTASPAAELQYVAFSPDGKLIACFGYKSGTGMYLYTYRFNPQETTPSNRIVLLSTYQSAAGTSNLISWSPDRRALAVSAGNAYAVIYGVVPGGTIQNWGSHILSGVVTTKWSPCGRYVAAGSPGTVTVSAFDDSTFVVVAQITGLTSTAITGLDWSPDGKYIAAGSSNTGGGDNKVWMLSFSGSQLSLVGSAQAVGNKIDSLSWSPDGKYIIASQYSGATSSSAYIYNAMYGPSNCLVDNCVIGDTTATAPTVGRGCASGSNAMFTRIVAANNSVNFSYGIPNVYDGRFEIPRNVVQPFDNVSYPSGR